MEITEKYHTGDKMDENIKNTIPTKKWVEEQIIFRKFVIERNMGALNFLENMLQQKIYSDEDIIATEGKEDLK